jgi:hypothetical protein
MLKAPHKKSDSEFYKKLETLVENYNSHHSGYSLNIHFEKNNQQDNTGPSYPLTYVRKILIFQ